MGWLLELYGHAATFVVRPSQVVFDRELFSGLAGSASFCIWLLAQTPQIYENYARGSVSGLSPFFLIQWMFGDLTNLIGAVLTHQLFFQIALATYFCCIDTVLLGQFWYYSHKNKSEGQGRGAHITVEEAERLIEEQVEESPMTPSQSRPDTASIRTSSTRSRWGYHSMRQNSVPRERSESYRERSQSTGRRRRRLTSNGTTIASSVPSLLSSQEDLAGQAQEQARAQGSGPAGTQHHPQHHHGPHHDAAASPLIASISGMSVTYRALSEAAMSVAQIADQAAERRIRGRDVTRAAEAVVRSPRPEGSRSRVGPAQRSRSERSVGRAGAGMVLLSVGMLFAVGRQNAPGEARAARREHSGVARWTRTSAAAAQKDRSGSSLLHLRWAGIRKDDGFSPLQERPAMRAQYESSGPLQISPLFDSAVTIEALAGRQDGSEFGAELVKRHYVSSHKDPEDEKHGRGPERPVPGQDPPPEAINWEQLIGRSSAWTCTVLYLTSRLPQIWTNHMRKSVEGLSMLLFIAAFLGNLFYTISILASPKAGDWWTLLAPPPGDPSARNGLTPENKAYLRESLPFLIGSFGASFFDVTILSQWLAFR
ncbi:hypothetical protein OC842_002170 [Tilletia horrida]|uniref:Uncharacterized protein n=1 Tax=Tilletia horrida TaxID=155126 RepID=A0AAN6GGF3_9BASI|nr:hypothetical protein OC842_002170 [Tilletia horrida]KAK0558603.1 hypothetical protein OC844_005028 [Tilletia horrida]